MKYCASIFYAAFSETLQVGYHFQDRNVISSINFLFSEHHLSHDNTQIYILKDLQLIEQVHWILFVRNCTVEQRSLFNIPYKNFRIVMLRSITQGIDVGRASLKTRIM